MNMVRLSDCGRFVHAWTGGAIAYTTALSGNIGGLHEAVAKASDYIRKWSGDEPIIERPLKAKMQAADVNLLRMAFGEEYR